MRILLAVDGSPSAEEARGLVAGMGWPAGTAIRLVAAYQGPAAALQSEATAHDATAELDACVEQAAGTLEGRGWQIERRVLDGRPAWVILDEAKRFDADLIVVGSRGHGTIAAMLLGSVSAEVVDHAPCPVLVARGSSVHRVLVAQDGSEMAEAIPNILERWGVMCDCRAIVLSVAPVPPSAFGLPMLPGGEPHRAGWQPEFLRHASELAERLAERLRRIGLEVQTDVRMGDPAHVIVEAAAEQEADLIMTGSRGLSGLRGVLLGSVARNVLLHAPCSVLVMRGRVDASAGAAR